MEKVQNLLSKLISLPVFTGIFLLNQNAIAGIPAPIGDVGFSIPGAAGAATAVPSLSGTMLIVLSLLLFIVAFRISKQKGAKANKFFVTLIGVAALSSSIGGVKIINEVNAGVAETVTMTLNQGPTTGSVPIFPGRNFYDNSFGAGIDATITSVNVTDTRYSCGPPLIVAARPIDGMAPTCSATTGDAGNIIQNTQQCQLSCDFNITVE